MAEAVIQVRDLYFDYPDGTQVLRGINLDIGEGEFIALIGQNGSGKTTLSKCLCGLLKPTKGTVLIGGMDTRARGITKKLVTVVGYVFQNPDHQLFNSSVKAEIAYAPRNIGLPPEEVEARVQEAARVAGVREELFDSHPFFLSKGLRQRVAIASILALRPKVVIVDEPTTGQDYRQSVEVMEFLRRLNEEEKHTIIIITHEMDIVAQYARRTIALANGEILMDEETPKVFARPELLRKTFVEPPQVTQLAHALGDLGMPAEVVSVDVLLREFLKLLDRKEGQVGARPAAGD